MVAAIPLIACALARLRRLRRGGAQAGPRQDGQRRDRDRDEAQGRDVRRPGRRSTAEEARRLAGVEPLPGGRLPPRHGRQRAGQTLPTAAARSASRRDAAALATGKGVEARFSCDALEFEWVPVKEADTQQWRDLSRGALRRRSARSRTASPPASRKVYYLVTDRGFGERGIRTHARLRPARHRVQVARPAGRGERRRGPPPSPTVSCSTA